MKIVSTNVCWRRLDRIVQKKRASVTNAARPADNCSKRKVQRATPRGAAPLPLTFWRYARFVSRFSAQLGGFDRNGSFKKFCGKLAAGAFKLRANYEFRRISTSRAARRLAPLRKRGGRRLVKTAASDRPATSIVREARQQAW